MSLARDDMIKKESLTIKDVAALAGVSKAAVSGVLNNKSRVGKEKEKKILDIIKQYNYLPRDSARALSTNRTYQIGYLVPSHVTLGLANNTFATYLAGVEICSQQRGYRVMASSCDISKVGNFLVLEKLRQRCVDGLIIAGLFNSEIVNKLRALEIPIIFIGGSNLKDILCLSSDMHKTYLKILEYLVSNGHSKIFFASNLKYITQVFQRAKTEFKVTQSANKVKFQYGQKDFSLDSFNNGREYAAQWIKSNNATRYTAFISDDQTCCGFLSEITKHGIMCPQEISIFSNIDSTLCQANAIPISAPGALLFDRGKLAANLLIDLLGNKKTLKQIQHILAAEYKPYELAIRSTTGKAFKAHGIKGGV